MHFLFLASSEISILLCFLFFTGVNLKPWQVFFSVFWVGVLVVDSGLVVDDVADFEELIYEVVDFVLG